jgi:uncharacterized membrane protein YecN with MAPEG domain
VENNPQCLIVLCVMEVGLQASVLAWVNAAAATAVRLQHLLLSSTDVWHRQRMSMARTFRALSFGLASISVSMPWWGIPETVW